MQSGMKLSLIWLLLPDSQGLRVVFPASHVTYRWQYFLFSVRALRGGTGGFLVGRVGRFHLGRRRREFGSRLRIDTVR